MGNNGGGSIFIALLLVGMVFGAGFLFSQDSNAAYNQQVAAEAAARVSAAEKLVLAAEARAADAEAKAAAAGKRAAEAEARAVDAEAKAVEAQQNLAALKVEHQQMVKRAAAEKNTANQQVIPVTSGGEKRGKVIELWLLPGVGVLIIGMLAVTAGQKLLRPGRQGMAASAEASSVTAVMMTREEARQYARIRRK